MGRGATRGQESLRDIATAYSARSEDAERIAFNVAVSYVVKEL